MIKFLIALQFLTIIPIKIKRELSKQEIGKSTIFFPLVGILIGSVLAFFSLLTTFLPQLVVSALLLFILAIITGGLHLDGFMDSCDGLYGSKTKEKRLEIMRDSHVGAIGVLAVILLLILKFSLLCSYPQKTLVKIVFLMPVFSRWVQVMECSFFTYARPDGKGRFFTEYSAGKEGLGATLITLPFFIIMLKLSGMGLFFVSLLPLVIFVLIIKKKLGGMTGDTIGASSEIAEVSLLLCGLLLKVT